MKKIALAVCALLFIAGCAKKSVAEDGSVGGVQVSTPPSTSEQEVTEPEQEVVQDEVQTPQSEEVAPEPEYESESTEATTEPQQTEESDKSIESGAIVGKVYFDYNKYNIRGDMQNAVQSAADEANEHKDYSVLVEGNTDEFGSDEYNLALGNRRALAIKRALVNVGDINANNIKTISLGKSKPVCQEKTSACYQENRRGDIKLVQ